MKERDALAWCRTHNAFVRFESNGTVTVKVNELRRRRPTFLEAVVAMKEHLGAVGDRPVVELGQDEAL